VLLDWVGSIGMEDELIQTMTEAGVNVQYYHPLRWYQTWRMNNRTHRKLLIIDGETGFIGGVGIADEWLGNAEDPEHWRDSHFLVKGPVVGQLQAAFLDGWLKTACEMLRGPDYFPPLEQHGSLHAQVLASSPSGGSESMHLLYQINISAAVESIDIAAAYFVPDTLSLEAIFDDNHAALFHVAHGAAAHPALGDAMHVNAAQYAGFQSDAFAHVLQCQRVHHRAQHPHVVGCRQADVRHVQLAAAHEIAAANHHGQLAGYLQHRLDRAGQRQHSLAVNAHAAGGAECFARDFQQGALEPWFVSHGRVVAAGGGGGQ
jgi:hypothetical protein